MQAQTPKLQAPAINLPPYYSPYPMKKEKVDKGRGEEKVNKLFYWFFSFLFSSQNSFSWIVFCCNAYI